MTMRLGLLLCVALGACGHMPRLDEAADPLSADEHLRLGAAYEAEGLSDDAMRQYQSAAELSPSGEQAWLAMGNIRFAHGDFSGAQSDFRRALKISPQSAAAQNNLAMAYLAQDKNLGEAEILAQSAIRINGPLQPYVLDTLAKIRARRAVSN